MDISCIFSIKMMLSFTSNISPADEDIRYECFGPVISGGGGNAQMRDLSLSPFLKALQLAGLLVPVVQMQMWSVRANLKVHVPPPPPAVIGRCARQKLQEEESSKSRTIPPRHCHRSRHHGLGTRQSCAPGYFQPHHPLWRQL